MSDLVEISQQDIKQYLKLAPKILQIPFYKSLISAGFPSPADDYMEGEIDLNQYLIKRPSSTFLFRMKSDAMKYAGILVDSILIVDRSISPKNGKVIVAEYNGQLIVRKYYKNNEIIKLLSENPKYPTLSINDFTPITIWGVVTSAITYV